MKTVFLYVTFPAGDEAEHLGTKAVEAGLAACVNILAPHRSIYRWKGELQSGQEQIAIFKTTSGREEALREYIKKGHSYECPCIATIGLEKINAEFSDWISELEKAEPWQR